MEYLTAMAGNRTVPVELGSHYLADDWGQKLMRLSDFISSHVLQVGDAAVLQPLGYLAQHPLFDQVPSLQRDIREPPWCVLGDGVMESVNAWFGPAGTVCVALANAHGPWCAGI